MTTGRQLVHESIAADYTALLAERADKLPVGDPFTGQVALGPIIDAKQRDHIHSLVTGSIAAGAKLAAGGTYEDLFYRPPCWPTPHSPRRHSPTKSSGQSHRSPPSPPSNRPSP